MSSDSNFKITKIAYAQTSNRRIINYADFTYNSNWREWTPTGTDIKTIYTHIDNEEIKATIRCSKFWIYGVKDSGQGIGTVKFGDILVDGFDQYSKESQYDLHVIYESPYFPLTNAELVINNTDDPSRAKTINFAYVEIQVEPAPYPVSDPISVSADAMQGRKETIYIDTCQEPGDENGPPCGEVAIPPSAGGKSMLLEYIFKGVRFQVFGSFGPGLGSYQLYLDDILLGTINQASKTRSVYELQYTSDIFKYGEHKIRVEADVGQKVEIYKFTYTLSLQAKRMSTSSWKGCIKNKNDLGGSYYFSSGGEAFRLTLSCSKYWVIGDFISGLGTVKATFSGKSITENAGKQEKLFYIYLESDQFDYQTEELVISNNGGAIYHYVYIIDEPDPEIPIRVPLSSMHPEGKYQCKDEKKCPSDAIATSPCGIMCWSSKDVLITYTYTFKGVKFQLVGTIFKDHRRFEVYLDDSFIARCDERYYENFVQFDNIFTSNTLQYGDHTVVVKSKEVFELSYMNYWVDIKAKRINTTQFDGKDDWLIESDTTGDLQLKVDQNTASIKKKIYASRFWIIGSKKNGKIVVNFKKEDETKEILSDEEVAVIYESKKYDCSYDDLLITANTQGIIINCIYIFNEGCPPQPTEYFSKSDDFTVSNPFTKSDNFRQTDKFTKSDVFSQTEKFTQSIKFTKSDNFRQTDKFTKSDAFSQSEKFTKSDNFRQTDKFTKSNVFSQTEKFTQSIKFTKSDNFHQSDKFTKSDAFSQSEKFAKSSFFSQSEKFTKSGFFSQSEKFKKTNPFSQSNKFTKSNLFSQSEKFKSSDYFSQSNKFTGSIFFSESAKFSQSELPSPDILPLGPSCGVFEDEDYFQIDFCKHSASSTKLVYVIVLLDNFSHYEQEEDGSVINIINCGLLCNFTNFVDCISSSGAGGAIYIKYSFDITNNATFVNSAFLRCKASYGGAVCILSTSSLFNITFTRCIFESNEALLIKNPTNENKNLIGGHAIFAICTGIYIANSSFLRNKGPNGAVKIIGYNDVNSKKSFLEKNENSFLVLGCNFEQHDNSKSSIYYINENSTTKVDILDCEFKGKLKKGTHYIDGIVEDKETLNIKSCNFENNKDAIKVELKNNEIHIKDDLSYFSSKVIYIFTCIIVSTALFTLLFLHHFRSRNSNSNTQNENNFNDIQISI